MRKRQHTRLQDKEKPDSKRPYAAKQTEENHHKQHNGEHSFNGVQTQHGADNQNRVADLYTVRAYYTKPEYLFAKGLSVFKNNRDNDVDNRSSKQ